MSEHKKLYKSRKDKLIDGVCGGMAEYFDIDPVIVRVVWAVLSFAGGLGIWAYVIAAIVIPPNPEHKNLPDDQKARHNPQMIWGAVLISIGIVFLLSNWHYPFLWTWPFDYWEWDWWAIPWGLIGPLALILIGAYYIYHVLNDSHREEQNASQTDGEHRRLTRPMNNRIVAGVCAAFGEHFNVDPTWIRIGFVLTALLTHGIPVVLIYVILIFVIPKAPQA